MRVTAAAVSLANEVVEGLRTATFGPGNHDDSAMLLVEAVNDVHKQLQQRRRKAKAKGGQREAESAFRQDIANSLHRGGGYRVPKPGKRDERVWQGDYRGMLAAPAGARPAIESTRVPANIRLHGDGYVDLARAPAPRLAEARRDGLVALSPAVALLLAASTACVAR